MRTIALSLVVAVALSFAVLAAEKTPMTSIANLATALSENDSDDALSYFDSHMKGYGAIEANIEAIVAQADVTCAIDIVSDEEANGVHKLDLDWLMTLRSQNNDTQLDRRRQRVQVEMRLIGTTWKITNISPASILDPIKIQ